MCDLHPKRKRTGCATCYPEQAQLEVESIVEDSNENLEPAITEQQHRVYDSKAIKVMIEAEIHKAIAKVRSEISDLMRINWEHLYVPYGSFSLALMNALEKEGWKYCDMIKNARQFGYMVDGDIFLLQRIIKKDNAPTPDFSKPSTLKRYLEKTDGNKTNI